tara:strand:+ start:386 stop:508 length:123 start_codon:yes stop_codon:yes gene_type:complete
MIRAKPSVKWIDIRIKLKKERTKTNANKKEKTNIVPFRKR